MSKNEMSKSAKGSMKKVEAQVSEKELWLSAQYQRDRVTSALEQVNEKPSK